MLFSIEKAFGSIATGVIKNKYVVAPKNLIFKLDYIPTKCPTRHIFGRINMKI